MRVFPKGEWEVDSILINHETVMYDQSFQQIVLTDHELVILPCEKKFQATFSTPETAVLRSDKEVFYAVFQRDGDRLLIELSRPKTREIIQIEASLARQAREWINEGSLASV